MNAGTFLPVITLWLKKALTFIIKLLKARLRRRTFHAANLIQRLSTTEEQCLNQIKLRAILNNLDTAHNTTSHVVLCDTGSTCV